jgi:hypothetical protein
MKLLIDLSACPYKHLKYSFKLKLDRPQRMFQNARSIDSHFASDELLYRRFCHDEVLENRLAPDSIKFPDWSVNRQKYSEPEDVLIPSGDKTYFCCGVAGFLVSDIPSKIDTDIVFSFIVEHRPEPDNYAHSELVTYKNGVSGKEIKNFKVSTKVKKAFRVALSDNTRIIISPSSTIDCAKSKNIN